jgi:hypothetical protein
MMPLTAAIHFVEWSDIHRADADLARENDRVPIPRQTQNYNRSKGIKFLICPLCVAATMSL